MITIAAVAVRIRLSTTLYLNPDEACHLLNATLRQWNAFPHPPLLLWWLWLAAHVSESVWWLRLLPALAGGLAPAAAAIWLRRFVSPITAWSLAALLGFAPVLVYLTIQLRGYSLAILAVPLALIALDRAFAKTSVLALAAHFAALYVGLLAEFSVVWIALAAGLCGLARFARVPGSRRLLPAWVAGQTVAVLALAWLYMWIAKPWLAAPDSSSSYLGCSLFPQGQNPVIFVFQGFISQFVYITGGTAQGLFAAGLYVLGVVSWVRTRDSRVILAAAPYVALVAGLAGMFPVGPTRHTVVIGLVSLAGVGMGIETVARRVPPFKYAAPLMLCALLLWKPRIDPMDIPRERWQRQGWDRAMAHFRATVPPGSIIVTSEAMLHMLEAYRVPFGLRPAAPVVSADDIGSARLDGLLFLAPTYTFAYLADPHVQANLLKTVAAIRDSDPDTPQTLWFLNGGWEAGCFPSDHRVMDGPEIFLGRLDPFPAEGTSR
ncbi:MAG: hypothetical protein K8T26_05830 [Lentisphaerae bacterium]|nr:hypothetical protein [Lentisphaerota bacterium]